MKRPRLLLVEDDSNLGYLLQEYLDLKAFDLTLLKESEFVLPFLENEPVDLCLLDVMMPGKDGFRLAAEIKARYPALPLIFLTAKSLKVDKLKGFALGADDYITKPVDEEELVARIHAVLRRTALPAAGLVAPTYHIGKYTFDTASQKLQFQKESVFLSAKEAELLQLLCLYKGRLLPRKEALKNLWGSTDYFSRRSMDVFISRLRTYLAKDHDVKIVNIHGKGFILEERSAE